MMLTTTCVVCFDPLTLAELAHSPCKYCYVDYCTHCLTRAFQIAEKEDVLEVQCPHCRKNLDADCMKIHKSRIKQWVEKELIQNKYGVLNQYKNKSKDDIVKIIYQTRTRDLGNLRRKSSIWEDQIRKLNLQSSAHINDIPLQPTFVHNQSQDLIDLKCKFTNRVKRSQSMPNALGFGASSSSSNDIKVFAKNNDDNKRRASTTRRKQRRAQMGLGTIIDEENELNDVQYNSPFSTSGTGINNNFQFPDSNNSTPNYGSTHYNHSNKNTSTTIGSIEDISISDHNHISQPKKPKKRLSASFKSLFNIKKTGSNPSTPNDFSDKDDNDKYKVKSKRRSSHKLFDRVRSFQKSKKKKKKSKMNKSATDLNNDNHLNIDNVQIRSITPDPISTTTITASSVPNPIGLPRFQTKKSNKMYMPPSPPPPAPRLNSLSLSYQKQYIQNKNRNRAGSIDEEEETEDEKSVSCNTPLPTLSLGISQSNPVIKSKHKWNNQISKPPGSMAHGRPLSLKSMQTQSAHPLTSPNYNRRKLLIPFTSSSTNSSPNNTPLSDLSNSTNVLNLFDVDSNQINLPIQKLSLAAIDSQKEQDDQAQIYQLDIDDNIQPLHQLDDDNSNTSNTTPHTIIRHQLSSDNDDNDNDNGVMYLNSNDIYMEDTDDLQTDQDYDDIPSKRLDDNDDDDLKDIPPMIMNNTQNTNTIGTVTTIGTMPEPNAYVIPGHIGIDGEIDESIENDDYLPPGIQTNLTANVTSLYSKQSKSKSPPSINTSLNNMIKYDDLSPPQQEGINTNNNNNSVKNSPVTPDTPPTPSTPVTGSISDQLHFDRVMQLDATLEDWKHKKEAEEQQKTASMQLNITKSTNSSLQNSSSQTSNNQRDFPSKNSSLQTSISTPEPQNISGCNGCKLCVIL